MAIQQWGGNWAIDLVVMSAEQADRETTMHGNAATLHPAWQRPTVRRLSAASMSEVGLNPDVTESMKEFGTPAPVS